MSITIAQLQAMSAAIKDTPSTKVEWNDSSSSLRVLVNSLITAMQERGNVTVSTVADLQALTSSDTLKATLIATASTGTYTYRTGAITPNGTTKFASADGGFWVKDDVVAP